MKKPLWKRECADASIGGPTVACNGKTSRTRPFRCMIRASSSMVRHILTLALLWLPAAAALARGADERVSFARQIQPILAARCQGCHTATLASGGMIVTTYAEFKKGGRHGAPFVSEKPADSLVVKHLTGAVEPRMPMG